MLSINGYYLLVILPGDIILPIRQDYVSILHSFFTPLLAPVQIWRERRRKAKNLPRTPTPVPSP